MWLEALRKSNLFHDDPGDLVCPWRIDIKAAAGEDAPLGSPTCYTVGRVLADELRRHEIAEQGADIWDVADADSSGLEAAWASLLDERGAFREEDFEVGADPIIYLYRFCLHDAFAESRLAVMDACSRAFGSEALVLAQHHTTWLSQAEFKLLGFHLLPPTCFPPPAGFEHIDRDTRFMVRQNVCLTDFKLTDYPYDVAPAESRHEEWLESQGQWERLI